MMEQEFLTRTEPPPPVFDSAIAMRVASLVVFLAAACFWGSPILYYGVSHEFSAANCMCVGGLLVLTSMLRLWLPLPTVGFSWFNAILGVWVLISPFIFGYTDQTGYTVNTLVTGVVIIGMSLASIYAAKFPGTLLASASDDFEGLTPEGEPPHSP